MKTILACGALAVHVKAIAKRLDLDVQVQPLPALLHNRPELIAPAVEEALQGREVVAVAYADCGTYGALDEVLGDVPRLEGAHCYDVLAGSFGAYLSPASAIRIGLVPRMALPRIVSAGNVASEGAKMAALSVRERAEARSLIAEVEYVELSGREDFNDMFIDELAFPG